MEILGVTLDPKKRTLLASNLDYIGANLDLSRVFSQGEATVQIKPDRKEDLLRTLASHRSSGTLSRSEAASLRGKIGFLSSQTIGKVFRGAESIMLRRQYYETSKQITPQLDIGLAYLEIVISRLRPRKVQLGPRQNGVALLYTDAMWEEGKPAMMAFVLDTPAMEKPFVGWTIVPQETLDRLLPRKQQIGQMEALAALLAPKWQKEQLFQQDIMFFCDNVAALCGLIGGHSSQQDTAAILGLFHIQIQGLQARIWGEHVESAANVADAPSREGPLFANLQGTDFHIQRTDLPHIDFQAGAPLEALLRAFEV
jgi:hypothetical protein